MEINQDQILEYGMKPEVNPFLICNISPIGDGKTLQIDCSNGDKYSIDVKKHKLYIGCSIKDKYNNKPEEDIKDELLINYLLDRMQIYSNRLKEESIYVKNLTNELLEKY